MSALQSIPHFRESPDVTLGKNLVVARLLAGVTQQELAAASGVSRATIAQLETGESDPRLSTIVEIARALQISPLVLLAGLQEVNAIAELPANLADHPVPIPSTDLARMELLLRSGLLSDRGRAARIGATVARATGDADSSTTLTAGIFSAFLPGSGTIAGTALGRLLG